MKVFLSYSDADQGLARRVAMALEKAGLDVWQSSRDVLPGDNWAASVAKALEECQPMVVLVTPRWLRSRWGMREIEYALGEESYNWRLIPVFIVGKARNFEDFEDEVPWILRRIQGVTLTYPVQEEGLQQIAKVMLNREAA
ncbi:MAG: toll/interleukin-1 receptor domain-containing protein [SAR202 cluster bacterium]|nr:toll/interleukin-1 receptor domain-containing protein [SAR202 cluster bacterium]